MNIKTFISEGYKIHEFADAVIEFNCELDEFSEHEVDDLDAGYLHGDVVETHFNDELSIYAILDKNENILFDQLSFSELQERIKSL